MHDIIIIGGGPAGCAAAMYAARAGLHTVVLEKLLPGGQMTQTMHIENYPGIPQPIDGMTLGENMRAAAEKFGAEFRISEALSADITKKIKRINTADGIFEAPALIIATGAAHKRLGIPGEDRLAGKGVSWCAACDGNLYKNKVTAVIGGGNSAAEEALMLARVCKRVLIIHRRDALRADAVYAERIRSTPNIDIIWNTRVTEMLGDDRLCAIRVCDETGKQREIPVDGVFVSIGMRPESGLVGNLADTDESGGIIADETGMTSIPGVFAAGDVRSKQLRQIVTAAADGVNSAHSCVKFLTENRHA